MKESDLIKNIQMAVSSVRVRLFRNSIGSYTSPSGAYIRYGVVNPGGSDLIGWTPHKVTMDDVGKTLAIFTAVEVKTGKLKATPQQLNFISQVLKSGGRAGVARSIEDALDIIEGFLNGNKED